MSLSIGSAMIYSLINSIDYYNDNTSSSFLQNGTQNGMHALDKLTRSNLIKHKMETSWILKITNVFVDV